jgi:ketosteroid isomerase-like protein
VIASFQRLSHLTAYLTAFVLLLGSAWADDKDSSDLTSIDRDVEEAVVQGDLKLLRQIYTEDFRFVHSTGEVQTKAQWLDYVADQPFSSRIVSDIKVESHGSAALTTGRIAVTERGPPDGRYALQYIRLYVLVDGRWRMASHHTIEFHAERD